MQGQGQKQEGCCGGFPRVSASREGWFGPGGGVEVGGKLDWDIF